MHKSLYYLFLLTIILSGCSESLTDQQYIQSAKEYYQKGDARTAVIQLKNAIQKNSKNAEARFLLGKIYLETGDGASAEKEIRRSLKLDNARHDAIVTLANALILQGKEDVLLKEIIVPKDIDKNTKAELYVLYSEAYLTKRELDQAGLYIDKAAELVGENVGVRIAKVKYLASKGKLDSALSEGRLLAADAPQSLDASLLSGELESNAGNYGNAVIAFKKVIDGSPKYLTVNTYRARLGLARAYIALNDLKAADSLVSKLAPLLPENLSVKFLQGLIAYLKEDYDKSAQLLQKVLAADPGHLQGVLLMGSVSYAIGNYEQANAYLERFVNKVPSHVHARKLLADTRIKLKQYGEAVEVLSPILKDNPGDSQLLSVIGKAAALSGEVDVGLGYMKEASKADPDSPSIRAELANLYMQQGAYDQAIKELETIEGQGAYKAKLLVIYAYLYKRDFAAARNLIAELEKEQSNDPYIQTLSGVIELLAGDRQKAKRIFRKVIASNNSYIPARIQLARILLEEGDLASADQQLTSILDIDSNNLKALLGKAQLAERKGNNKKALELVMQARSTNEKAILPRLILGKYYLKSKGYEQALEVLSEAQSIEPESPIVGILLGKAQMQAGSMSDAAATFKGLISKHPDSARMHYEYAAFQIFNDKKASAKESLAKAMQLKPDFLLARIALIRLEMLDNPKEALALTQQLKKDYPEQAAAHVLDGDIYVRQKKYQSALSSYNKALKREENSIIIRKIANTYKLSGDAQNAEAVLNEWLQRHPQDMVIRLIIATHALQANNNKTAIKHYQLVLDQQPDNIVALNNLAYIYLDAEKGKALSYAKKAYRLSPHNDMIADTLGWVYVDHGQYDKAIALLKPAAEKTKNPSIEYHLAVALAKKGDRQAARDILSKLMKSDDQFPERQSAGALLKTL